MSRQNFSLSGFDKDYRRRWKIQRLAGVDEAGRGCLAGPVVAAAVILEPGRIIRGLNDSKQLSGQKRESFFFKICERAQAVSIGWASAEEIDRLNILQATHLAAVRALGLLRPAPEGIVTDYLKLPVSEGMRLDAIVKGDGRSQSIAAASIIAKVTRDRWMRDLDGEFPGYGMARHKGYGTAEHVEAIQRLGSSTLHRQTFKGVSWFNLAPRPSVSCIKFQESELCKTLEEAVDSWMGSGLCLPECEEGLLQKAFEMRKKTGKRSERTA